MSWVSPNQQQWGRKVYSWLNIQIFTPFHKNRLHFNCLIDGFTMYNDKLPILKQEVVTPIYDSMIPVDFSQNNYHVIIFTPDDIRSKFESFSKNKMDALYLTESMQKEWFQMLDEYWDEVNKTYSDCFEFSPHWLF